MATETRIEQRRYGYWPSADFMRNHTCSVHGKFIPFWDHDIKTRGGQKDDWIILCTVNGADGPYLEEREVTYGPWVSKGRVARR